MALTNPPEAIESMKPLFPKLLSTGAPTFPNWLNRLAKPLVLNALKAMSQGHIALTLPDGETHCLGKVNKPPETRSLNSSGYNATIQVNNPDFFSKILLYGHIGFGEAYMAGDWDTDDIREVISWAILNVDSSPVLEGAKNHSLALNALGMLNRLAHLLRPNSLHSSKANIREHYDLSNDFFALFLDDSMTYSSARFLSPEQDLASAQTEKYDALCRKLQIKPTDHILEIGTGWGGFSLHAARHYGCRITTTTISLEQAALAAERFQEAGLAEQITLEVKDYRLLTGQYDKIVSIEMLEAVGDAYMEPFFRQCGTLLKPNGLLGLQMILCPDNRYKLLKDNVDFIQKHIFPGSLLPSLARITQAMNRHQDSAGGLFMFDLEDMGASYARTLAIWHDRFNQELPAILSLGFDESFIRKWNYYFKYCQAAFEMRNITVAQAIYTRANNPLLQVRV
jgi:cyclopropane-fatty-acyl-phospholipid synthase